MKIEQIIRIRKELFSIKNPLNMEDATDPCWEGYEQIGTKELDGKTVPNCVPIQAKKVKDGFPIPSKSEGETKDEYISRCMKDIGSEYDTEEQALAVCYSQFAEVGPKGHPKAK